MDDTFISVLMMKAVDRVCQSHGKHSPPEIINVVFSLIKREQPIYGSSTVFVYFNWGGWQEKSLLHIQTQDFLTKYL